MKKLWTILCVMALAAAAYAGQANTWPTDSDSQTWPTDSQTWPSDSQTWPSDSDSQTWPATGHRTSSADSGTWPSDGYPNAGYPQDGYPQEISSSETKQQKAAKPAGPLNNFYFLDFKWGITSASSSSSGKSAKYRSSDGKATLRISQEVEKPSCKGWTTCEEKQCKNSKNKYWFLTTAEKTESWLSVDIDKKDSVTQNTEKKTNPFDLYLMTPAGSIRFQMESSQSPILEEKFYSQLLCQDGEDLLPKVIANL